MLPLLFMLATVAAQSPWSTNLTPTSYSPDQSAIESIKAGKHNCPHCNLTGADLTNQCVKEGNLEGGSSMAPVSC